MTMAMRGVVLALLVLRRVPGSHSPTVRIEGGLQNCPWAVPTRPLSSNSVSDIPNSNSLHSWACPACGSLCRLKLVSIA